MFLLRKLQITVAFFFLSFFTPVQEIEIIFYRQSYDPGPFINSY
uniref:Uncharacterized protein n=1 Tax=Anguilla anguilla TaxID=7936 RepID=A0A0E9RR17_ANGAN